MVEEEEEEEEEEAMRCSCFASSTCVPKITKVSETAKKASKNNTEISIVCVFSQLFSVMRHLGLFQDLLIKYRELVQFIISRPTPIAVIRLLGVMQENRILEIRFN